MADARTVWLEGPAGKLEGALRVAASPKAAAVLAHPHPLYGGTLHNPVIFHADRELHRRGLTTLRFDFRGAGGSEGFHDDGRGEVEDVASAAAWLRGIAPGVPLVLVGYSFGSRCCVFHALGDLAVAAVVAIGFPWRVWDLSATADLGRPFGVVQGSRDEYGTPDEIAPLLARMSPPGRLYVVDGAEHLFPGRAPEAAARAADAVEDALATL